MSIGRFRTQCGATNAPNANFCAGYHQPLATLAQPSAIAVPTPSTPETGAPTGGAPVVPPPTDSRSVFDARGKVKRRYVVVAIMVPVVVAVLVSLPFPQPFSFDVSDPGSATVASCHRISFFSNAPVQFRWSTPDGSTVSFSVIDPSGGQAYLQVGSNGSGAFIALNGGYQFCVHTQDSNSVRVSGTADEAVL